MAKTIGIIGEGVTDHEALMAIITSFTGDKNILFTPLQPRPSEAGNWDKVIRYCASTDFRSAFDNPDLYVAIQIDTDFLRGDSVPERFRQPGLAQLTPADTLAFMRQLLINEIGPDFYAANAARIIFAITVDQLECWFLGIYYPEKKAEKHINCLDNLNKILPSKEDFTISGKEIGYYRTICKHFKKRDKLIEYSRPNYSFRAFIAELDLKLTLHPDLE